MPVLFEKGLIVDGSGSEPYYGSVLVHGDRIVAADPQVLTTSDDTLRINCDGLVVAPGFIDVHSHSDLHVLHNATEKLHQGVTSEVVGNCGFSAFPCGNHSQEVRAFANGILCGAGDWGWPSSQEYLAAAMREARLTNVFSLTGHGTLRVAHAGFTQGPLTPQKLDSLKCGLSESLAGGAIGFSTGLMYAPGSSAPFEELVALCQVTARHNRIYCSHMRSYSWDLLDALQEQISLSKASGCRLQISHLQTVGRANWHLQAAALERIEAAREEGIDIAFDSYPFLAGSTVMTQLLPQQALEGGTSALLRRLQNGSHRRDIEREAESAMAQSWDDVFVNGVNSRKNLSVVGLSLQEIAIQRNRTPIQTVTDLLLEEECEVNILSFNQSDQNLRELLTHPLCSIISDGFYVNGRPHPRLYGTFPELLATYVRERGWLTLPEAIHKITQQPAQRFHLKDRGSLRPGAFADITVFNPLTIRSRANYANPKQAPDGIAFVFRNGHNIFSVRPPLA